MSEGKVMLKVFLKAALRVLAGAIVILTLAATVGIPKGRRSPAAAPSAWPEGNAEATTAQSNTPLH